MFMYSSFGYCIFFQLRFMVALNGIYNAKISKAPSTVMICLQRHFIIECHLMSFIHENCRIRIFESTKPKKVQDIIGNCFWLLFFSNYQKSTCGLNAWLLWLPSNSGFVNSNFLKKLREGTVQTTHQVWFEVLIEKGCETP